MAAKPRPRRRLDLASVAGVPLGLALILGGQALEGGRAHTLFQLAAALVVFGGTLGAVLVSFGPTDLRRAISSLPSAFFDPLEPAQAAIGRIVSYARRARREGVLSLESNLHLEPDPFLRKALTMAVDGSSQSQIRQTLEIEIEALSDYEEMPARVFEASGGYAPTIGILGAVLGLIQVMENLSDPSKLGPGIAIAFVATVYGVGSANLILLPIATKLRYRADAAMRRRELLLEGVLAIQEGINPQILQQRLASYVAVHPEEKRAVPFRAAAMQGERG